MIRKSPPAAGGEKPVETLTGPGYLAITPPPGETKNDPPADDNPVTDMIYIIAAYLVFSLHLVFIAFVPLGGLLVLRNRRWAWVHVPVFLWGAGISFGGWICPLTPLENWLRERGGALGYPGGFIDHYLVPLIYPTGLTRTHQYLLGAFVLLLNLTVYALALRHRRRHGQSCLHTERELN